MVVWRIVRRCASRGMRSDILERARGPGVVLGREGVGRGVPVGARGGDGGDGTRAAPAGSGGRGTLLLALLIRDIIHSRHSYVKTYVAAGLFRHSCTLRPPGSRRPAAACRL